MNNNIKTWAHGLAAVIIAGAATSAAFVMTSDDFYLLTDWKKLLIVALTSGLACALGYLKQSPLPVDSAKITQTTTTEVTKVASLILISVLFLGGCATADLKNFETASGKALASVSGILTAADEVWSSVGKTVTTPQFEALMVSAGVPQADLPGIEKIIGLGSTAGAVSVTLTGSTASLLYTLGTSQ